MELQGKVWKYGDNINTDLIISGKYLAMSTAEQARHVMEDLDKDFAGKVSQGDILVAGINFGCGSSRENAPAVLRSAGISAVVAVSFARIFFRNAINLGMPVLECADISEIKEGDLIKLRPLDGEIMLLTKNKLLQATRLPPFIAEILQHGGLVPYMQKQRK